MKKFRFALLALVVSAATFSFTPSSPKAPLSTVYAFTSSGTLMDSASSRAALKIKLCPGEDLVFCAEVWTSKTAQNQPAGEQLEDIKKPNTP